MAAAFAGGAFDGQASGRDAAEIDAARGCLELEKIGAAEEFGASFVLQLKGFAVLAENARSVLGIIEGEAENELRFVGL